MEMREEQHVGIKKARVKKKGKVGKKYMYLISSIGLDSSIDRDPLYL
jgi:hypothetical protein